MRAWPQGSQLNGWRMGRRAAGGMGEGRAPPPRAWPRGLLLWGKGQVQMWAEASPRQDGGWGAAGGLWVGGS